MKKIICLILSVMLCACAMAFVGCGECKHTYNDVYSKNDFYHWQDSTCGCGVIRNKEQHNFYQNSCLLCGAQQVGTEGLVYADISNNTCWVVGVEDTSVTDIVIPRSYNNKLVKEIKGGAFANCSNLSSINIHDDITAIGASAFAGCSSLKSIKIPDSVTSLGESIFYECTALESVNFSGSFVNIPNSAFSSCISLNFIPIPDGIKTIGAQAFANCTSLSRIWLVDSVISIGESAFANCSGLKKVNIGTGVSSIGAFAFMGCNNLRIFEFDAYTGWKAGDNNVASNFIQTDERIIELITQRYVSLIWTRG